MQKLVKSFSDANAASNDQGLDFDAMGRYFLRRYIRIATNLVDRVQRIVVFADDQDQVPHRPVFSGNPHPEPAYRLDPIPSVIRIPRRNGHMQVPIFRYYSNDLREWVYQLKIPFPRGTTAEAAYREIRLIVPNGPVCRRGNTVYLVARLVESL